MRAFRVWRSSNFLTFFSLSVIFSDLHKLQCDFTIVLFLKTSSSFSGSRSFFFSFFAFLLYQIFLFYRMQNLRGAGRKMVPLMRHKVSLMRKQRKMALTLTLNNFRPSSRTKTLKLSTTMEASTVFLTNSNHRKNKVFKLAKSENLRSAATFSAQTLMLRNRRKAFGVLCGMRCRT